MNIRYKERGFAVKFDGSNFDDILALPNVQTNVIERFGSVEYWIREATEIDGTPQEPKPKVRSADDTWIHVNKNQYFVVIDGVDIVMEERDFNNLFEEIEETV